MKKTNVSKENKHLHKTQAAEAVYRKTGETTNSNVSSNSSKCCENTKLEIIKLEINKSKKSNEMLTIDSFFAISDIRILIMPAASPQGK